MTELEAAILADPDAREGYAVLGDWLLQQGDPRGEFIQVQLARELAPDDAALERRERELLAQHESTWSNYLRHSPWSFAAFDLTWRRGHIYSATIPTMYETEDAASQYRELAALPVARFLRELSVGSAISHHGEGAADVSILEALRDCPLPVLRDLSIDSYDHDISWTHIGDISIANVRGIETLSVSAGRLTLGAIDLPKLRRLTLVTGGLTADVLESIARAAWPALEELVIYFGTERYGGTCTARDVLPILEGANLPRVTKLGLCNGEFADELAELVATSAILPRLTHLDLSKGTMGADGAGALARHRRAFAHLASLDLSFNYLPAAACGELANIAAAVDISYQSVEGEYGRFVQVSE
jgi:uncharacterized protein (TIGR02996 family)